MERELPSQVEESPVSNRRIHYKRHWKAIGNTGQLLHERAVTFIRVAHEGFKIMATRVTGRNNSFMSISKSSLIRRLTNPTAISRSTVQRVDRYVDLYSLVVFMK